MIEPRTVWSFVVGLSLACGPVVDDGRLEQPVWSQSAVDDTILACVPVDDGCLRLRLDLSWERADPLIAGALVGVTCLASSEPLADVQSLDALVYFGHGTLRIAGDLSLDDGTILALDAHVSPVDHVDGASCD